MNPVSPDIPGVPEHLIAKDQPEYIPLRVCVLPHDLGRTLLTRWTLSDEERRRIAAGEDLYIGQLNWGGPFTPLMVGLRETFVVEAGQVVRTGP